MEHTTEPVDELIGRVERLYQSLTGQEADLRGAIEATEELIGRLEAEINERFHAAFVAIGSRSSFANATSRVRLNPSGLTIGTTIVRVRSTRSVVRGSEP